MARRISGVLLAAACASAFACRPGAGPATSAAEVKAVRVPVLPAAADDAAWAGAPVHAAALLPQDVVEPRLLAPTTATVDAQALTDGTRIAFRLAWRTTARSDKSGPALFSDACAVQLSASPDATLPNPMMGEPGRPVEVAYWRAAWQAEVDGRTDRLAALHPGLHVDHYPFEAAALKAGSPEQQAMAVRFAPAVAVGNRMAQVAKSAVQDLIATGAGTLTPAAETRSTASGKATAAGWTVAIVRPLPAGLKPGARSQVAFAVWQGAKGEVGARKMRTGWIPLFVEAPPAQAAGARP